MDVYMKTVCAMLLLAVSLSHCGTLLLHGEQKRKVCTETAIIYSLLAEGEAAAYADDPEKQREVWDRYTWLLLAMCGDPPSVKQG